MAPLLLWLKVSALRVDLEGGVLCVCVCVSRPTLGSGISSLLLLGSCVGQGHSKRRHNGPCC